MSGVRTRFAPSPTGALHIGGLRTALFAYAFAKSQKGEFVLRIEDTDRKRLVPGATEKIYEVLKIFGIDWDEGPLVDGPHKPYIQSERAASGIYKKYAEKLIEEGRAYYCFCSAKAKEEIEEEHEEKIINLRDECRNLSVNEVSSKLKEDLTPAIRLRVPDNETVGYRDFIIDKDISWETKNIDEVMLLKSDGFPTYHLAVVVDDFLMEISHVLRGHDWLPSTPVHLLLIRYLEFPQPEIGHLTDILDPEGGKLSKRKGAVSCEEFLAEGYLPEAILNFIMLLGWAPKDNRELFTLQEFVDNFQKGSLQVANPVFNRAKLDWFNGIYLRQKTDEELVQLISGGAGSGFARRPFVPDGADTTLINKTIPLIKERITKLSDYPVLAGFFFEEPKTERALFGGEASVHLSAALEVLDKVQDWKKENLEQLLQGLVVKRNWKTGEFFMNFRVAITGSQVTPPIVDSIAILGKEKTLKRMKGVLEIL